MLEVHKPRDNWLFAKPTRNPMGHGFERRFRANHGGGGSDQWIAGIDMIAGGFERDVPGGTVMARHCPEKDSQRSLVLRGRNSVISFAGSVR